VTEPDHLSLTTIRETARRMGVTSHVVRGMIERDELPVARRARQHDLLHWPLIQKRLDVGGEFTANWWKPE
jgi:hypothetical protein